ncbi:MAG: hypothetical protein ACR2NL_01250 [Acidimicrobiia bacterium]
MKSLLVLTRVGLAIVATTAIALLVSAASSGSTSIGYDPDGGVAAPPLPTNVPTAGFDPSRDLANVDGSVVVTSESEAMRIIDGETGETLATRPLGQSAEVRAVSADGSLVALFEQRANTTSITVVNADDRRSPRTYRFDGLVEPEAFSTDGSLLYVIDHEISKTPGAYRVRPLDLNSGELDVMLGPQKVPIPEDMNGSGRRQVWSPVGDRLYTLYIRQTVHIHDDGEDHVHGTSGTDGFVHVLDLAEEWAFCLHLPDGFGKGELDGTSVALDPSGRQLAILDLNAGKLAWASTEELTITEVVNLPADLGVEGQVHLAVTPRHLAIGWGTEVHWFDRNTLVESVTASSVGSSLVGLTSAGNHVVAWTDTAEPLSPPAG